VAGEHSVLRGAVAAQRPPAPSSWFTRAGAAGRRWTPSLASGAGRGDTSRLIISHVERTLFCVDDFIKLAQTGCYLEFDLFGLESSYYPWSPVDMPNDATRTDYIIALCSREFGDQVLMSHDIDMKVRLEKYGGEGCGHIFGALYRSCAERARGCRGHKAPAR
jgi:phosphotriesterase-related protein